MRTAWKAILGVALAGIVCASVYGASVRRTGRLEAELAATRDSAAAAIKANALLRANLQQALQQAATMFNRARAAEQSAAATRATADSLARVRRAQRDAGPVPATPLTGPVSGDSVVWLQRQLALADAEILARTHEADSLRAAGVAKDSAIAKLAKAAAEAAGETLATQRALERVEVALRTATASCAILRVLSCPSRTTTAIGAAAVATLATLWVTK